MDKVRIGAKDAPDLLVSFHWSAAVSASGTAGLLVADSTKKGTHGSLSPYDMHNTLVAAGPDFRSGFKDELPTGNLDLAPTILWILGIEPPHSMDGRVLKEALIGLPARKAKPEKRTLEATCAGEHFRWRQYLKVSTIGKEDYFEEGNGESVQK